MKYCIYKSRYKTRENIYNQTGKQDIEWIPCAEFGYHKLIVDAKLKFLIDMQILSPFKTYTNKFINDSFKPFQNMKHYKVLKIKEE